MEASKNKLDTQTGQEYNQTIVDPKQSQKIIISHQSPKKIIDKKMNEVLMVIGKKKISITPQNASSDRNSNKS